MFLHDHHPLCRLALILESRFLESISLLQIFIFRDGASSPF